MPIVAMIIGKPDFSDLTFTINDAVFRYGAFLTDADHVRRDRRGDLLLRRQAGAALIARARPRPAEERSFRTRSGATRSSWRRSGIARWRQPDPLGEALDRRPRASSKTCRSRVVEEDEAHLVEPASTAAWRLDGDRRRQLRRVAVDPARERRERDGPAAELQSDLERAAVSRGEQLRPPRTPSRHTGPTAWITQRAGSRPAPVAFASPVSQPPSAPALGEDLGAAARWIAPSDAAAAEQRLVGGVHDRVHLLLR